MLIVVPEGGLCNRMRVISSAVVLAKALDTRLKVIWMCSPDINCKMSDLFEMNNINFDIYEIKNVTKLHKAAIRLLEMALRLSTLFRIGIKETLVADFDINKFIAEAKLKQHCYIRTNKKLMSAEGMLDIFRPVAEVWDVIKTYRTAGRQVGVHIRRTDNVKAIALSPNSLFIEKMQEEKAKDENVSFFVATDDKSVFNEIKSVFGDAVIEHPKKTYSRDDPAAIKDALIDLYALSECDKLIGSYWSSFTDIAWEIRNIDHVIAIKEE